MPRSSSGTYILQIIALAVIGLHAQHIKRLYNGWLKPLVQIVIFEVVTEVFGSERLLAAQIFKAFYVLQNRLESEDCVVQKLSGG